MIRNSTLRTLSGTHAASGTPSLVPVVSTNPIVLRPRPRRCPRIHAVVVTSKLSSTRGFASLSSSTPLTLTHVSSSPVSHLGAQRGSPRTISSRLVTSTGSVQPTPTSSPSPSSSTPFSTSMSLKNNKVSKKKKKEKTTEEESHTLDSKSAKRTPSPSTLAATQIEDDVIYRREGSKIVPVTPATDQIKAPVSGLFSQFENMVEPNLVSALSESIPPKPKSNESIDLSSLTIRDVLPDDQLLERLIRQGELSITVDQTKELVVPILGVLSLAENDPKRVKVEKEFLKECKKKMVPTRELASWSLQFSRDGGPLALSLYRILADNGDFSSRYSYGVILYRGSKGVPADPVKGRMIIESLAKPRTSDLFVSFPWAQMTLGSIYARDDKNFEAARDMYMAASNAGIVEAKVSLGRMYLSGELPKDITKAKKYFEQAIAIEDNGEAHFLLGVLEMSQEKPNVEAVFRHYEKAASQGLPEAQYNLGLAYFRGSGILKNDSLAIEYWKMAGQQGFGLAQLCLGAYYFQDETPQEQRDPKTGKVKGIKHEWDPSKKDLMQAQKWFTLASRRPGELGLEGKRLKAHVDEAIRKGGGRSRDGRACIIM